MLFYNKCIKYAIQSSPRSSRDKTMMKLVKVFQDFKNTIKEKIYINGDKQIEIDKTLRHAYKTVIIQTAAIKG